MAKWSRNLSILAFLSLLIAIFLISLTQETLSSAIAATLIFATPIISFIAIILGFISRKEIEQRSTANIGITIGIIMLIISLLLIPYLTVSQV